MAQTVQQRIDRVANAALRAINSANSGGTASRAAAKAQHAAWQIRELVAAHPEARDHGNACIVAMLQAMGWTDIDDSWLCK